MDLHIRYSLSSSSSMSDAVQAPAPPAETSGSPAEFLKNVVGKEVKVRIGQGIDYQGRDRSILLSRCCVLTFVHCREPLLSGRIHERGDGEHQGSRGWTGDGVVWRCVHTWEQRSVIRSLINPVETTYSWAQCSTFRRWRRSSFGQEQARRERTCSPDSMYNMMIGTSSAIKMII